MRAILSIAIGVAMIAAGLRLFPDLKDMPLFPAAILVLFGLVVVYAGCYHAWLRIQRRRAYAGGRERHGIARLLKGIGEEDTIAFLIFENSHSQWMMSVDSSSISKVEGDLTQGVSARAYLGNDDKIYGLDIGPVKALPISVGLPYEGKFRERIEWAERKKTELAKRAASN